MKKRVPLGGLLCGFALVLAASCDTKAGVVGIARESKVRLQGAANAESYDDQRSTTGFGMFDDGLSFDVGDPSATHSRGSVSQETLIDLVTAGVLEASGDLYAEAFAQFAPGDTGGPLNVLGESLMTLVFDVVAEAEPYRSEGAFGGPGFRGASGSIGLQEVSNPAAVINLFSDNNEMYATFDRQGQLQPGRYRLYAVVSAGSSGSSPGDPLSFGQDTSLNFNFAVGQSAASIPLPPAVWPGLAMLLSAGAASMWRRGKV